MATIDYERKYKALVEAVKTLKEANQSDEGIQNWVKDNVLELVESEDERIRKELLAVINDLVLPDDQQSRFVAWIEKQGKQDMGISEATKQKLEDNLHKALEKETQESCNEFLEKQGEQKAKYHDVCDKCVRQPTCQSDCFLQQGEQEPAEWSEEDEIYKRRTIEVLEKLRCHHLYDYDITDSINWLKSLRHRNRWKPSDEQMNALDDVISSRYIKYDVLSELWKDLKKLREE